MTGQADTLREALEGLANFWATGGNGIDAAAEDLISACSAELLRVLDEHPVGQDAPGSEPEPRYALVEQMGYRQVIGTVAEVQFVGRPMLEVTALDTGSTRLVGADGLYQLTWMTRDQAERATRTGAHSVAAIAAADAEEFAGHVSMFGAWADGDNEDDHADRCADSLEDIEDRA